MPNYTRHMKQTATYWAPGSNDGFGGVGFSAPVTIKCRWQDKAELFRDSQARELTSSSIVYPELPLRRQGYLYLGESSEADPANLIDAKEIRQTGSSPSLTNSETLNKVWL